MPKFLSETIVLRKKGMTRTGFKRKEGASLNPLKQSNPMTRSSGIKKRRRRARPGKDKRLRDACAGEPCYLRVDGICLGHHESVVDCHSNELAHGKGKGLKSRDEFTVPGCSPCHYWLDFGPAPRAEKFGAFRRAHAEWVSARNAKLGIFNLEAA
jgi:Protein of unknown function (DUF1364)